MLSFLKTHPFAVEAYFDSSTVLTFAFPKDQLIDFIPECLELDVFDDQWAFVAVAIVKTRQMRPKGFPKLMGRKFFLMGYRIFTRYKTSSGRNLRGLYIIKSDTNSRFMEMMGNLMTEYKYEFMHTNISNIEGAVRVEVLKTGFEVSIDKKNEDIALPTGSPFADWKAARRFAGPMPYTFSYKKESQEVLMIEGVRSHWKPRPIAVKSYNIPLLKTLSSEKPLLASAFIVENVPYYWKKGKVDLWTKE